MKVFYHIFLNVDQTSYILSLFRSCDRPRHTHYTAYTDRPTYYR